MRLFFALQPKPEQCAAFAAAAAPLVVELGAQSVPADTLHATLCFVGAVPEESLARLIAAAAQVRGARVSLRFDALEYWEEPGILCATAPDDAAVIAARELSRGLARALVAAGFTPDVKPFRPHLTLARKVRAASAAQRVWPLALPVAEVVACERFVLMQSRPGSAGSIYSDVESWPLDELAEK